MMMYAWIAAQPFIPSPSTDVPPPRQAELEADTPPDDGWEQSPLKEDATARRVRRMLGWNDDS